MSQESACPECSGVGTFRNSDGRLVPCYRCKGAGILVEESAYRHLANPRHSILDGICSGCAGTGCDLCRQTGKQYRQFAREIGHLSKLKPPRKPVTRELGEPERKERQA